MKPAGFAFSSEVRVRFSETDAQRVVYHANYLIYCEVARTEYFRAFVLDAMSDGAGEAAELFSRYNALLVHAACDFRSPAHFDELLTVWTRVGHLGQSSFGFDYRIQSGERLVCEAKTVQAAVGKSSGKSEALPVAFKERMLAFEEKLRNGL